ncbi:MAG: hypothetical protein AB7U38_04915 [Hyphomicrobiales bacterium]
MKSGDPSGGADALRRAHGLTRLINAAGSFTPAGVSRSPPAVREAVAAALSDMFVIEEMQQRAGAAVAAWAGAEAAAITHCASSGITLAIAAAIAGDDPARVAAMPDTSGLATRVVLPAGHAVDYGHPIVQDIRLAGGTPVLAGSESGCTSRDLETELNAPDAACLLLVSSRLVRGAPLDLSAAVATAHGAGLPAIVDGAAQDMRIPELLATGADLLLVSAQKYLASPTAGLVIGRARWVEAVRAHEAGIGRAMKPSKEALAGVLAAVAERRSLDMERWRADQAAKAARLVDAVAGLTGIRAEAVPDPAGMPFPRVQLTVEPAAAGMDASALAAALRQGDPAIWVMQHKLAEGRILMELVQLTSAEIDEIARRLADLVPRPS